VTDTRVDTTTTPPPPAPSTASAPPVDPAASGSDPASTTATAADPPEPVYKALYEQAQAKLKTAEQTARTHRDKAKRLDEIEAAQQTETEKAAARAEQAERQVTELRHRAVDAEIRAAATSWANPTDAPLYLPDRDKYVREGGEIDTAAITADLSAVLAGRPHLARVDGPRRPAPDLSQGARPGAVSTLDTQIAEAEKKGDWRAAIRLKAQQALDLARSSPPTNVSP
jgi:hypothetical protein